MNAEEIVRALAHADPHWYATGMWHGCVFCDASLPTKPEAHEADCPWRLAVEWVALNGSP